MKIQFSLLLLVILLSTLPNPEAKENGTESNVSSFGSKTKSAVKKVLNKAADKVLNRSPKEVNNTNNVPKNSTSTFSKIKEKGKDVIKNKIGISKDKMINKVAAKLAKKLPWWVWFIVAVCSISFAVIVIFILVKIYKK